ncbi:MAG: DUF4366 domain-containing protein, partial [Defluviitaleaceae bacterium]|nr:DUF4366 domain-containing protein [Defluviitaleaceae bacterium]
MKTKKKFCVIFAIAAAVIGAAFFMKRRKRRKVVLLMIAALAIFVFSATAFADENKISHEETVTHNREIIFADENDASDNEIIFADKNDAHSEIIFSETKINEIIIHPEITIPAISRDPFEVLDTLFLPAPQIFTPPGNMNLIDDFCDETADSKQFITVTTRNGHFFYIVIDRAAENNNVHFLNQVDEFDLLAILEDEAIQPKIPAPIASVTEETPEAETEPEKPAATKKPQGSAGNLILMLVIVGVIGGGAYYFFKARKQETSNAIVSSQNEFDFDDDFDEIIS